MQIEQNKSEAVNAKGKKVGIVVSKFNKEVTQAMLSSAKEKLADCQVEETDVRVVEVAGAIEIPYALQKLAKSGKFDCLVAIGCVIRGDTPHFDYVCKSAQEGVLRVSLDHSIPIGFGVITVNTLEQTKSRFHVGGGAVLAALELTLLD